MTIAMELWHDAATRVCTDADVYGELLELDGKRIVELGCGAGENARAIASAGGDRRVIAFEVDERQHAKNLVSESPSNLEFRYGGAEHIECADGSVDVVFMIKSLHHVPVPMMPRAFSEIARVLAPGGYVYVSEPVFDGPFNEIIRIFHDEQAVRLAAFEAACAAVECGLFALEAECFFHAPLSFPDFAAFEDRLIRATHTVHHLSEADYAEVTTRFESHLGADGARFEVPMRVDLLRKPLSRAGAAPA